MLGRPKAADVKGRSVESTKNLAKVKVEKRVKGHGANLAWATCSEVSKVPSTAVKTIEEVDVICSDVHDSRASENIPAKETIEVDAIYLTFIKEFRLKTM